MRTDKRFGILFLCLFIFTAACGQAGSGAKATPTLVPTPVTVEKPTYTVQRGEVTLVSQMNGRVTPVLQQDLYFRTDGVVKEVLVHSGDSVVQGDVLARLDEPERYQSEVAAAELAFEQAKLHLEEERLDIPVRAAQARVDVQEAAAALETAKNERAAMQYSRVTDGLTLEQLRAEVQTAKAAMDTAQQNFDDVYGHPENDPYRQTLLDVLIEARSVYNRAVANLNWAEGKATQTELDLADARLALAQANYDQAVGEAERWTEDGINAEIRLAELSVTDAQAKFTQAQKALEAVELRAPFDGEVLSLGIAPGSQVSAFQSVLTLADPAELEITAVPAVEVLARLGIGQTAQIRFNAQQGTQYAGVIADMPLSLSSSGGTANDSTVHFALDAGGPALNLGDAVTIVVTLDSRQDVLWLPPAAIRTFQDQDFVFVESAGVQRRVNITLGLQSADRVEILTGLEEGQVVVGQ